MSIAMALHIGDDVDALGPSLQFHLNTGVDLVVISELERSSETESVVERHAPRGAVRFVPEPLAQLRSPELAADWVIESGADEFWWPRAGPLKDVLDSTPKRYDAVQAVVRGFVPVPGSQSFVERMVYRLAAQAPVGDPANPWRPARKFVYRAGRSVRRPLRGWYPIEVLHFPVRGESSDQATLADDALVEDTRLRDAMRTIASGATPAFPRPTAVEEARFAADVAVLGEADVISAQRRLDELEERLAAVEATTPVRLERSLRSLVRHRFPRS